VRAFNPFPGASTRLAGDPLKVWAASVGVGQVPVGHVCGEIVTVAHDYIAIYAANSIVNITEVQRAGGKRLAVADFLRGVDLQPGTLLG